jgi:SAM-dependent methyltransferase
MDAQQWNERYRSASSVWSGEPNAALVLHAPEPAHPDSTALDLGCGEGGDALWLAARGWHVVGVDWAGVALERARRAAADSGTDARFVEGDITDATTLATLSDTGTFDLVTVAFLHPEPEERPQVYAHLAGLLAPGGHLIVVAHDPEHGAQGLPGPQHHRLMSPDDIIGALALAEGYEVLVAAREEQSRVGAVTAVDSVVVVERQPASD